MRTVTSALALLLITPLFAGVAPTALADEDPPVDPPGDSSPIGDGASSPLKDYIQGTIIDDGETELTVGNVSENACVKLAGTVTPADIPERYRTNPPAGDGAWEFQVCAADAATARRVADNYPTVPAAKDHCKVDPHDPPAADATPCAVFVYWHPAVRQIPPLPDQSRQSYFRSFFQFSPRLGASPGLDANHGAIVNFPTWVWNTVDTTLPKVVTEFGLAGGLFATAWHLNTTLDTNDQKPSICRVAGLRWVGTDWEEVKNRVPPQQASPDCGHTYTNIGTYNVHGCSQWLIIAVSPFFVIVFPITVCSNTTVTVKESQILTGGDATRARVN